MCWWVSNRDQLTEPDTDPDLRGLRQSDDLNVSKDSAESCWMGSARKHRQALVWESQETPRY